MNAAAINALTMDLSANKSVDLTTSSIAVNISVICSSASWLRD